MLLNFIGENLAQGVTIRSQGGGFQLLSSFYTENSITGTYDVINALPVSGQVTHICLVPKYGGSLILGAMPDGTASYGNARGTNAVDLQMVRSSATQIASDLSAFCCGRYNTSNAQDSVAMGNSNISSGNQALSMGNVCTASGSQSFAVGQQNNATNNQSVALGYGCTASGTQSIAFGRDSAATGGNTVAIGRRAKSNSQWLFCIK